MFINNGGGGWVLVTRGDLGELTDVINMETRNQSEGGGKEG